MKNSWVCHCQLHIIWAKWFCRKSLHFLGGRTWSSLFRISEEARLIKPFTDHCTHPLIHFCFSGSLPRYSGETVQPYHANHSWRTQTCECGCTYRLSIAHSRIALLVLRGHAKTDICNGVREIWHSISVSQTYLTIYDQHLQWNT